MATRGRCWFGPLLALLSLATLPDALPAVEGSRYRMKAGERDPQAKKDIIITLKKGTSDTDIAAMCKGGACQLAGHPSEGGMPFVKVHGTDSDVEAVLEAAGDKVEGEEPDGEVYAIPELPADPDAPVLLQAPKKDIIITLKKGTSDTDIAAMCKGGACQLTGHPSEGGMPFVKVHGTDSDVEAVLEAAGDKVEGEEPDGEVYAIPELPADPDAPVLLQAPKKDFIIMLKKGASDKDIEAICKGRACQTEGHPSEGGVPFITVHGTENELQAVLDAAGDKVESEEDDEMINLIPEMPDHPDAPVF